MSLLVGVRGDIPTERANDTGKTAAAPQSGQGAVILLEDLGFLCYNFTK